MKSFAVLYFLLGLLYSIMYFNRVSIDFYKATQLEQEFQSLLSSDHSLLPFFGLCDGFVPEHGLCGGLQLNG